MFSIQSFYDFYYILANHNIHLSESQLSFLIYLWRKLGGHKWILLLIPWNVFFFFFPEITVTGIFLSVLFYFVNNFVSFFWYFTISHLFITCQLIWGFERNILLFPVINIRCHYIEEESLYSLRTHSSVTSGRSVTLLCI